MEDKGIYLVRFIRPGNNYWEISICDDPKIAFDCMDIARMKGCVKQGVSRLTLVKSAEEFSETFDHKEDKIMNEAKIISKETILQKMAGVDVPDKLIERTNTKILEAAHEGETSVEITADDGLTQNNRYAYMKMLAASGYDAKTGWLGTRPGFVSIEW